MAIAITADNFESEVLNSDIPVLVDFFATWCGPCSALGPIVEEVAAERKDIKVCKLDIDNNMKIARKFRVMSVPTLVLVEGGKEVKRSVGLVSKDEIYEMLP